jgi:hypothetical protein
MNDSEMAAGGLDKLETIEKRLQAVYKQGALYPLEPLQLQDMQEVTAEEWLEAQTDTVTWTRCGRPWPEFPARSLILYPSNGKSADCPSIFSTRVPSPSFITAKSALNTWIGFSRRRVPNL